MLEAIKKFIEANAEWKKKDAELKELQCNEMRRKQMIKNDYLNIGNLIFPCLANSKMQGLESPMRLTDICDSENLKICRTKELVYTIDVDENINKSVLISKLVDCFAKAFGITSNEVKNRYDFKINGKTLIIRDIR